MAQTKTETIIKGVASLAGGKSLVEIASSILKDEFGGDWNHYREKWQRQPGEPLFSAENILKMIALVLGEELYRHVDPFPNSKADNIAGYGIGAYLLYLLLKPQSAELGGPFRTMESKIAEALATRYKNRPQKIREGLVWLVGLTPHQQAAFASLTASFQDPKNILTIMGSDEFKLIFPRLAGEPPAPRQLASAMESMHAFGHDVDRVLVGDDNNPGPLRRFRRWLEAREG